jgi:hypothetical protein
MLPRRYLDHNDVNAQDTETGMTALHRAVIEGSIEGVTFLLSVAADPSIAEKGGGTPMQFCLDPSGILLHDPELRNTLMALLQGPDDGTSDGGGKGGGGGGGGSEGGVGSLNNVVALTRG